MANLKQELEKLLPQKRGGGRLAKAPDREPIPAAQGVGTRTAIAGSRGGSGGVSWPLTEVPGTRTYHASRYVTSTDGLFAWEYQNTDTIIFTDADGFGASIILEDVGSGT